MLGLLISILIAALAEILKWIFVGGESIIKSMSVVHRKRFGRALALMRILSQRLRELGIEEEKTTWEVVYDEAGKDISSLAKSVLRLRSSSKSTPAAKRPATKAARGK